MFFKKKKPAPKRREDIYKEEWEDWTKEDWINHQTPDEQNRLRALTPTESDEEFCKWCLAQSVALNKKLDELRSHGILPPLKGLPKIGPISNSHTKEYFDVYGRNVGSSVSDEDGNTSYYDRDGVYIGSSR